MKTFFIWLCLSVPCVFASEYTVTVPQRTDLLTLPSEVKQQVPTLRGAYETLADHTVTFQRESGDFTEAEKALIDQVVLNHDPLNRKKVQTSKNRARQDAQAKLEALGLTKEEAESLFN